MSAEAASISAAYAAANSLKELMSCVREFDNAGCPVGPRASNVRLAITGNYSTQFLAKAMPLALAARDIRADLYESAYRQWQIEMRNPASSLYSFRPSHILMLLTSIDLAYGSPRVAEKVVSEIADAVGLALRNSEARILVTLPEPLVDEMSDNMGAYVWRTEVTSGLRDRLTSARVTLVDLDPLIRSVGAKAWYDNKFYDAAKLPFHPDRTPQVLARLSDVIAGTISPRCKLVVVDLDDTLWGGRVGDDGWDGIDLDPSTQGRHFLRMQAFLKGLHEKGVVLAIASKNEPSPVREVFEKRAEMMLSLDEFSAIEIHWAPKSESIARILARLNLSTAGVVFLDDNPAERAEVARRFPDICIPQLSENPADRVPALISSGLFDRRVSTAESRARHRMYAENAHREQALSRTGDIDEFLRDLNMVMEISRGESSQERVLELIQKTNQFNLTTRRYNWGELLAATNGGFVHCYRLKDKFGDNGIISVVAVSRDCSGEARIDLWLMSCRVFGRKVEDRIFRDVARRARVLGAKTLVGEYIETPKNDIVRNLYPRLGCSERGRQGEKVVYEYSIADEMVGAGDELFRIVDKTDAGARCRD